MSYEVGQAIRIIAKLDDELVEVGQLYVIDKVDEQDDELPVRVQVQHEGGHWLQAEQFERIALVTDGTVPAWVVWNKFSEGLSVTLNPITAEEWRKRYDVHEIRVPERVPEFDVGEVARYEDQFVIVNRKMDEHDVYQIRFPFGYAAVDATKLKKVEL